MDRNRTFVVTLEVPNADGPAAPPIAGSASLSRAVDLLGIIHGQRGAKVEAASPWLLTAQR